MSAEQDLANAVVKMSELVKEVQLWKPVAAGLANIYPTITEGRQNTDDGKYFSVPASGTAFRLYRRQGTSAELISEFPDATAVNAVLDQLGPLLGRGVVGGAGDLMARTAYGVGATTEDALANQYIGDMNNLLTGGDYPCRAGNPNSPTGNAGVCSVYPNSSERIVQKWRNTPTSGDAATYERQQKTDLTFTPWSLGYNSDTVVGAVQDVGGRNFGAVIEIGGSGTDGYYVKLAGGLLLCVLKNCNFGSAVASGTGDFSNPYMTNPLDWYYPYPFVGRGPEYVGGQLNNAVGSVMNASQRIGALTSYRTDSASVASSLRWVTLNNSGSSSDVLVDLIAVGFWK